MNDQLNEKLVQKISVAFAKRNVAIYLSHLDLMRHFSRTLRRANLRPRLTAGFNPRPRLVFPHPLPLGVWSECEIAEIEFCENYSLPEIFTALKTADGGVIDFISIETMKPVKSGKIVARCEYEISDFPDSAFANLPDSIAKILNAEKLLIIRGGENKQRQVDIRPFIESCAPLAQRVQVILKHSATGAGRIDDLAKLLLPPAAGDWHSLTLRKTAMFFQ